MQEVLCKFRSEHMGTSWNGDSHQLFHTPILEVPDALGDAWDADDIGQALSVSDGPVVSAIMMPATDSAGRLFATLMPVPRIDQLRGTLLGNSMLTGIGDERDPSQFRFGIPMGNGGDDFVEREFMHSVSGKVVRYNRIVFCRTDGSGLLHDVLFERSLAH